LLRKALSEPLLHFLLLGLLLFLVYQMTTPGSNSGSERTIRIAEADIINLAQQFESVWLRLPNGDELNALIDNYIREEILYREAVALGLDQDDSVIKRRVLQKLEALTDDAGFIAPPGDEELNAFLLENTDRFAYPPLLDMQQVLFDPRRRGSSMNADIDAGLAALRAGADPATVGDSTMLPLAVRQVPLDRLAREFGDDFVSAVVALPPGSWEGPVQSGFGLHIVRVDSKTANQPAVLEDVRAQVERDWENARLIEAREEYYQQLRQSYVIQVESSLMEAMSTEP
jgi:hypothetical protein